ncbi:hypothetical protein SRHO_G00133310 [Serrasalmus rhombeus]
MATTPRPGGGPEAGEKRVPEESEHQAIQNLTYTSCVIGQYEMREGVGLGGYCWGSHCSVSVAPDRDVSKRRMKEGQGSGQ